jgi:hypothetical protein
VDSSQQDRTTVNHGSIGKDDGAIHKDDGVIVSTSTSSESSQQSSVESAVFVSSPFSLPEAQSQPQNMSTVDPTRISLHKRRIGVERTRMDATSNVDISRLDCFVWIPKEIQYLDVPTDNTMNNNKQQKTKNT